MRDIKQFSVQMERIIHKYNQVEVKAREYGTGTPITRVEIHTIVAIVENPGISITELAKKQGITKGATSQMVYKLVDKRMVEKRVSPHSDAQISIYATEIGKAAYEGHEAFHKNNEIIYFKMLQELPDETFEQLLKVFQTMEELMDKSLK